MLKTSHHCWVALQNFCSFIFPTKNFPALESQSVSRNQASEQNKNKHKKKRIICAANEDETSITSATLVHTKIKLKIQSSSILSTNESFPPKCTRVCVILTAQSNVFFLIFALHILFRGFCYDFISLKLHGLLHGKLHSDGFYTKFSVFILKNELIKNKPLNHFLSFLVI